MKDMDKNKDHQWSNLIELVQKWENIGYLSSQQGSRAIGHVPKLGEKYFLHTIYAPLSETRILEMEKSISKELPPILKQFYRKANGVRLFKNLSCYGYTFDKDELGQPISIRYGNVVEVPKNLPVGAIVIGSVTTKTTEGFAYLVALDDDSIIVTKDKKCFEITDEWEDVFEMLFSEANRLKVHYNSEGICNNESAVLR